MRSSVLYFKHRLATSALAGPVSGLRDFVRRFRARNHPELALLKAEDKIIEQKLRQIVTPNMACLDVGAHVGAVAHLLESLAGRGKVKLVEAVPEKARWLTKRFGAEHVTSCAIAEDGDTVAFYVDEDRPGYSGLTGREGMRRIEVPARQLDALYPTEKFGFIKIDVEGHELTALRSGRALLERSRPVILFEAGPANTPAADSSDALFDWLTHQMHYEIFAAFGTFHKSDPLTLAEFRRYRSYPFLALNYFAFPRAMHATPPQSEVLQ